MKIIAMDYSTPLYAKKRLQIIENIMKRKKKNLSINKINSFYVLIVTT